MACVDDQVVLDTLMNNVRLRVSLTRHAVRPQRFPCSGNVVITGHPYT